MRAVSSSDSGKSADQSPRPAATARKAWTFVVGAPLPTSSVADGVVLHLAVRDSRDPGDGAVLAVGDPEVVAVEGEASRTLADVYRLVDGMTLGVEPDHVSRRARDPDRSGPGDDVLRRLDRRHLRDRLARRRIEDADGVVVDTVEPAHIAGAAGEGEDGDRDGGRQCAGGGADDEGAR